MVFFLLCGTSLTAADSLGVEKFWAELQKHCGQAYEGNITEGGREGDGFTGQRLVMRVLSCEDSRIRIPFFVGEDRSRTWILTRKDDLLELKHDHRQADGSEDKVTRYGGTATNTGSAVLQVFPADPYTCQLLNYACGNIWWITLDGTRFTYNLRRIGSDRIFSVAFDLTRPVAFEEKPWGWQE